MPHPGSLKGKLTWNCYCNFPLFVDKLEATKSFWQILEMDVIHRSPDAKERE